MKEQPLWKKEKYNENTIYINFILIKISKWYKYNEVIIYKSFKPFKLD